MIRLYKFRALANELDFYRLKEILETERFWCSRFWELNDPMEGAFKSYFAVDNAAEDKNEWLICAFSGEDALNDLRMWGYYANGFKGVAIEIEIEEKDKKMHKINYTKKITEITSQRLSKEEVKKVLRTKLEIWTHEKEYRFLTQKTLNPGEDQNQEIGTIKKIYLGDPHGWASNSEKIDVIDKKLNQYKKYAQKIKTLAKNKKIECDYFIYKEKTNTIAPLN